MRFLTVTGCSYEASLETFSAANGYATPLSHVSK